LHKIENKPSSKGLLLANDCYLDECRAIDLALSNLWLEFGPEWVDYCFVFLCSCEDCDLANDLRTCVSQWQQKLSANLGIDIIVTDESIFTFI